MVPDGLIAIIAGFLIVGYHYTLNRDIRRTLHRIADDISALREASHPNDGEQ